MADKLLFSALHLFALLLFVASSWGYGQALLARALRGCDVDPWLGHGLCIATGMGLWICALQWLGIAGAMKPPAVYALAAAGCIAAGFRLMVLQGGRRRFQPAFLHPASALVVLAGCATLLSPLRPPQAWDELSYHLPHAREWAESGSLVVNEWLRYPWFPFNFDLLFAAALAVYDDVLPHTIHALAGWLVALLLYRIANRQLGRGPACLAALIWLWLTRGDYASAYIDMGLTLFVLAAYAAFELWREHPHRRSWLALSAFSLGVAAGTKYQALAFLPLLAGGIALTQRRASNWLLAAFWLAVPCAYWYLRNAIMIGDPVHPLGGWLFGFSDWNLGDLRYQLEDIRRERGWPGRLVWPAVFALLMKSTWQRPGHRMAMLFCVYAVAVWLATSGYPRYLMPAYPLLAMLAAKAWFSAFEFAARLAKGSAAAASLWQGSRARVLGASSLALMALLAVANGARDWARIAATPQERQALLRNELPEYMATLDYLATLSQPRIYQSGMEGVLYYAPRPMRGDHFGRWRYRDFVTLEPASLAARLRSEDLDTLVLRLDTNKALLAHPQFAASFEPLQLTSHFGIYRTRPAAPIHDPRELP